MADKFDPYHKWLGIPPRDQPPHHYRLLSIDLFESDAEVIDAAARRLAVYVKSCAAGPHQSEAKKLLAEIVQARLCLMDPQLRAAYDQRLAAPPPGAPPVEPGPAQPGTSTTARAKRAPTAAIATAKALSNAPQPKPPAPPAPKAARSKSPLVEIAAEQPPAQLADTPMEGTDTVAEMPAGINTLPEPTFRSKSRRSGSHKSSAQKSGAHKAVELAGMPLPGVKAKRRKGNQMSPKMVMLILGGVVLAVGIVAAVFMRQPEEPQSEKDKPKVAESIQADEKPKPLAAVEGSEPAEAETEMASAEGAAFEDDDSSAKPRGPGAPALTKRPGASRGSSNSTGLLDAIDEDATAADVQKLIAAGADVSAKNKDGRTALRLAVVKGRVDLVKALLAAKANPNAADVRGETPLMSAAKAGNAPIVKMLLEAGANPNAQTALPLAPLKKTDAAQ